MVRHRLQPDQVFPAHAGMSLRVGVANVDRLCFPRSRGDEPEVREYAEELLPFSPLTRG